MAANRPTQKRATTTPTPAANSKSALIWGSLAFCSILAVVSLIALRISAPGGTTVLARATTPPPQQPVIQRPSAVSEFEIARLNDAVRALAAERDRLASRVDTLEQSLGDITASINAKTEAKAESNSETKTDTKEAKAEEKAETRAAPAPAVAAPAPEPVKQETARAPEPPAPAPESAPPAPKPVIADNPAPTPAPMPPPAPQKVSAEHTASSPAATPPQPMSFFSALNPPANGEKQEPSILERLMGGAHTPPIWMQRPGATGNAVAKKPTPKHKTKLTKTQPTIVPLPPETPEHMASNSTHKTGGTQVAHARVGQQPDVTGSTSTVVGIDLGGETSIEGLRSRWTILKGKHGADLAGLRPLVRVREGSKPGTVELHLVAGPVANAGTAARLCSGLRSSGVPCQASEFDGQSLPTR